MPLTLLLDLDDTLLNTNLPAFIPAYFQALAKQFAPLVSPDVMMRALMAGTSLMNESEDFSRTLKEVFDSVFFSKLNLAPESIHDSIEDFYDNIFPSLQHLTSPNPHAKPFVEWALAQGYRVAIATDPLLPRKANLHRIRWAGLNPEQFEIISSYEHFSFTKTHAAYYAEILGRMGWQDGAVLMVGNDMERDILPAQKLGLAAYFINGEPEPPPGVTHGTLDDLTKWLPAAESSGALIPSLKSLDAVTAILSSTPAVINGLTRELDSTFKPLSASGGWSLTEIVCHLRDTEREIHHMQINVFKQQNEPFIPRPDTSVWSSQRDYAREDFGSALREFGEARRETLAMLKNIPPEEWSRKARHAIFGPTNFLEVVGFMSDHDRMHVQQAWKACKQL